MSINYAHTVKSERLIAAGRLGIAALGLLIFWIGPLAMNHDTATSRVLIAGYWVFAMLMLPLVWLNHIHLRWLKLVSHFLDLLVISSFVFITQNSLTFLIVYFIFALFCVALRWHRTGVTWIALAIVFLFLGLDLAIELYGKIAAFEINQAIIRIACLAIITLLIIYLDSSKQDLKEDLQRLSAWSHTVPNAQNMEEFLQAILQHAAEVMRAPRILMVWNEAGDSHIHIAKPGGGNFQLQEISSSLFRPLVEKIVGLEAFLCLNASTATPKTILSTPWGLRYKNGLPLHNELTEAFEIKQVLATVLNGEKFFNGWLLFLDKPDMTVDEFHLASIIAKRITADMEQFYLQRQLNNTLITEERLRISRDLHDNMLQFLPGIGLYLETINQLLPADTQQIKAQLQEIQDLIADKQRELRDFVKQLKTGDNTSAEADLECHTCLECVSRTLTHQWGMKVSFTGEPLIVRMPSARAQEIRYLIHEAMINSARHSKGKEIHAAIHREGDDLQILVRDNGRGFPFKGRYGLDELNAKHLGPKTLKERITALGGWLVIDSSTTGSNLWISLPVPQPLNS